MLAIFADRTKVDGWDDWWNASRRPDGLFSLVPVAWRSGTCLAQGAGRKRAALLFSSRALTGEYARVKKWDANPLFILCAQVCAQAESWRRQGLDEFVLDCCPRCAVAGFVPLDTLKIPERWGRLWAVTLQVRDRRMRAFASAAFQSLLRKQVDDIIPKLKEMRDHVDPGCAAVHYTLALLQPLEVPSGRQELVSVSKERLIDLGYKALADDVPNGAEGLLLGFARLRQMAEGNFSAAQEPRKPDGVLANS